MSGGGRKVQYATAISASSSMIYLGIVLGWPSPMIPKLLEGEAGIEISKEQCSWIASLVAFGGIFGCILAQYFVDVIGRKKTLLLMAVPCIVGASMTAFASTPVLLYVARFTNGIGTAMAAVTLSIYIGEVSDKEIRGALGTLLTTMANIGNLLVFAIGPFVSYKTLNLICLTIPIASFVACIWIPESPYYYLKNDRLEDAGKEMMKLKSLSSVKPIENELIKIQEIVKKDMEKKTSVIELLTKKDYRKSIIVLGGLKIFQQMTGSLVIQSYFGSILRQTKMNISGATGSVIYGIIQVIMGIVLATLVDKMGRKPLLFISSLGVGLSLTIVGMYFFVKNVLRGGIETLLDISWLPISGLIGFNIFYAIGLGNLPYVLQSELFPTNVKSAASSTASIFGSIMAASITKSYQGLADAYGIHSVMWLFALIAFIGVPFAYFVVPETKGKSLEEIQKEMKNHSYMKNNENLVETIPLEEK